MAGIDAEIFAKVRSVIFGSDSDPHHPDLPLLDGYEAGVVLEVMKDLLYEAYVRRGKLRQAMTVRRFLTEEKSANVAVLANAKT